MVERTHPDMWVDPEADPRTDSGATDERGVLLDYLHNYRLTFEMKCEGLDAEQLATRSVPPSSLSLLGLLRHLAGVEQHWFRTVLGGDAAPRHYRNPEDRDADFNDAVADDEVVAEAWATWRSEVTHAERFVATAPTLDVTGEHHGDPVSLRDILVHMIEEYARHVGHADLLRECIDGRTGQ